MQQGSVIREHRKTGPDVWCFRWWESGPSGNRIHRRVVLGTAEQLRDISSARLMTTGLVRQINASDIRFARTSLTMRQLADHFHQCELAATNARISYSTKKAYGGYLNRWIVPRWGSYLLPDIKAVEVELWLKHLQLAPGDTVQDSKRHDRSFQPRPTLRSVRPQSDSVGAAERETTHRSRCAYQL